VALQKHQYGSSPNPTMGGRIANRWTGKPRIKTHG
jgi:hypothetical protein